MKITELFDAPTPGAEYSGEEHHRINFNVGGNQYQAIIEMFDEGDWEVSFTINNDGIWDDEATGSGNEIKVFSTVVNFVVQFLGKHLSDVRTLVFTSDQTSRTRLYNRMARLCAKRYNLKLDVQPIREGKIEFVLTNPAY